MPTLLLDQDDIQPEIDVGTNLFAPMDGVFWFDESSPAWWSTYYKTDANSFGPGFIWRAVNKTIHQGHWLRFKIPIEYNNYWVIDEASLQFFWYPTAGTTVGNFRANIGSSEQLGIFRVHVYNNSGADISYPASAADATTKMNSSSVVTWNNAQTQTDPGSHISSVITPDISSGLQLATITQPSWVSGNHVLMFLSGIVNLPIGDRRLQLLNWSWIYYLIANGYAPSSHWDYKPKLKIVYHLETPGNDLGNHVEHTLSIVQEYDELGNILFPDYEHTLDILQTITTSRVLSRTVEHTLEVIQDVHPIQTMSVTVEQSLFVYQTITPQKVHSVSLEQELNLQQTIEPNVGFYKTVYQDLSIEQDISTSKIYNRTVEHTLSPVQSMSYNGILAGSITHFLVITQEFENTNPTINPINVTHSLNVEQWYGSPGLTPFVDPKTPGSVRSRSINSSFDIGGGAKGHGFDTNHVFLGYNPSTLTWSGGGGGLPANCDRKDLIYDGPSPPVLTPSGQLTLEYPTVTPTFTATLPPPVLGNQHDLLKTRIQRRSRAGDLKVYIDPTWPEKVTFRFTFQDLTDTEKTDFALLVAASLGQLVRLTDHEGRVWDGVITNPNGEYMHVFRECGVTAEFDFEWVQVP